MPLQYIVAKDTVIKGVAVPKNAVFEYDVPSKTFSYISKEGQDKKIVLSAEEVDKIKGLEKHDNLSPIEGLPQIDEIKP